MARTKKAYEPGTLCVVADCQKPAEKKLMCNPHYQRQRLGRPIDVRMRPRQYENLKHAVDFNTIETEHGLLWVGTICYRSGYGKLGNKTAHRIAWELVNGPVPKYHELDHNPDCPKNCVTVEHLTPRTKSDHAKIGWERGQFEGNGWSSEARTKRTKTDNCLFCDEEYTRDVKAKYCSKECSIKAGNLKRKERGYELANLITQTLRDRVWSEEKGICGICLKSADPNFWHLDHIIPKSQGGQLIRSNVQVSHPRCNLIKGNKMPDTEKEENQWDVQGLDHVYRL